MVFPPFQNSGQPLTRSREFECMCVLEDYAAFRRRPRDTVYLLRPQQEKSAPLDGGPAGLAAWCPGMWMAGNSLGATVRHLLLKSKTYHTFGDESNTAPRIASLPGTGCEYFAGREGNFRAVCWQSRGMRRRRRFKIGPRVFENRTVHHAEMAYSHGFSRSNPLQWGELTSTRHAHKLGTGLARQEIETRPSGKRA